MSVEVISLGGSIVAPDAVDTGFLAGFRRAVLEHLAADPARKLILVVGGGGPARRYQSAYRSLAPAPDDAAQDWIGIAATRLNGQLLHGIFQPEAAEPLVSDPSAASAFSGRVLVAAGWKPGFSTDYDAVVLAERFGAKTVINLSNIAKVHTADPRKDPSARPIEALDWKGFRALVGDDWTPGTNLPFDPVAARKAQALGLRVIVAAGKDLANLAAILEGRPFTGTVIGPD